jgi:hypothetical protein
MSLCYLPNNSKVLNTLHSSFQICHIIKHSQKYYKNRSKVASPFTIQIKDFEHSIFNFPNLQHHKPLTIFFFKPFKICLYRGPSNSKIYSTLHSSFQSTKSQTTPNKFTKTIQVLLHLCHLSWIGIKLYHWKQHTIFFHDFL